MCERCVELEREVAALRSGFQLDGSTPLETLRLHFGIQPGVARAMLALYLAPGFIGSRELERAVVSNLREATSPVAKVQVCRCRRALGERSVINVWGRGYRLSNAARTLVFSILNPGVEPPEYGPDIVAAPKVETGQRKARESHPGRAGARREEPSLRRFSWEAPE